MFNTKDFSKRGEPRKIIYPLSWKNQLCQFEKLFSLKRGGQRVSYQRMQWATKNLQKKLKHIDTLAHIERHIEKWV